MNYFRQATSTKQQLSYTPPTPAKGTFNRQSMDDHSSSNNEKAPLRRQESDISLYDQTSTLSDFIDEERKNNSNNSVPWTRKQWEALEDWYVKQDRDCQRAANAFFIYESVISESSPPLWSKGYILWRCRCLDTNTKYHNGILPSERKRVKDKLKNLVKRRDLLRPKRSTQQHQQQQQKQQHLRHLQHRP